MPKPSKTDSFQFKAEFLPITTLRLLQSDSTLLKKQLENTIKKAPQYFSNAPVILDFTSMDESEDELNIQEICAVLRNLKIQPIAARGLKEQTMLPVLPEATQKTASQPVQPKENAVKKTTLTITKPVRAGTQIYAKDSDLIILSNVNAGAEVIADGNIHVYGPLRGRALAGAQGDMSARIFCKELEAELIAIAGRYWVNEKIKSLALNQVFVQLFLEAGELKAEIL